MASYVITCEVERNPFQHHDLRREVASTIFEISRLVVQPSSLAILPHWPHSGQWERTRRMRNLMLLTMLGGVAFAQGPYCTNLSLKGTYAYTVAGLRPAASSPGQLEQVFALGIRRFDGEGNFTQTQTEKGSLTAAPVVDAQSSGTYTVNTDCTGTFQGPGPVQARFVLMERGKEIRWVVTAPAVVAISGTATLQ